MASKGDFIGFTFNGHHSSELGITRVSNGSRYNDNLLPTFQDNTAVVAGGDGTYFWNSYFTQKPFPLQIAFDSLTEKQYRELRQWLGTKEIHELIFDEQPYKKYMVKTQGTPQLKTICFNKYSEDNKRVIERIYKGEGTVNFVAYFPYAKSVHKWLDEYDDLNKAEWAESSGMKKSQGSYDGIGERINLYNPGDIETDFCLFFNFETDNLEIKNIYIDGDNSKQLQFNPITKKKEDFGIRVNSKTNLVEGVDADGALTGNLYNEYIKAGDFFKIDLGESTLEIDGAGCSKIEYDYLYY